MCSKNEELVSVITASYNVEDYIGKTIRSVINQSYENWELIIADDCSSDRSIDVITEFMEREPRIRLVRLEQNSGPAIARNEAIGLSRGRYIAFLDSDDQWNPEKLECQLDFMRQAKSSFTYTGYEVINEADEFQ